MCTQAITSVREHKLIKCLYCFVFSSRSHLQAAGRIHQFVVQMRRFGLRKQRKISEHSPGIEAHADNEHDARAQCELKDSVN